MLWGKNLSSRASGTGYFLVFWYVHGPMPNQKRRRFLYIQETTAFYLLIPDQPFVDQHAVERGILIENRIDRRFVDQPDYPCAASS
jgi:hypothetical protein